MVLVRTLSRVDCAGLAPVSAMEPIEDNWAELVPGWLTDPVLKLRLWTTNGKEYDPNSANLHLKYEPAIDPDRMMVPPTEQTKRIRRANPKNTQEDIEAPAMASSMEGIIVDRWVITWNHVTDGVLRIKLDSGLYSIELSERAYVKKQIPIVADKPRSIILYAVQSIVKMHALCGRPFEERAPGVERIEVCVKTEVARTFFGLGSDYAEIELGWVRVASREVVQ